MAENKDLYGILGVTQGKAATPEEIKKTYLKAVMKHHPDRNGGSEESKLKFQEINEANRILSDATLRAIYDRSGYLAVVDHEAGGIGNSGASPSDIATDARRRKRYSESEVWDFFGGGKSQTPPVTPTPNTATSAPASSATTDREEAMRRRREQMRNATGNKAQSTAPQEPYVDTRALARSFNDAGEKISQAAAGLRGASTIPAAMTEEARLALESASAKARELVREIDGWKAKFKR